MRFVLLLLVILMVCSCERAATFNAEAAQRFFQSADAQNRTKATVYAFQRPDGSWVYISTAPLRESKRGVVHGGSAVLQSGYIVYPGAHHAESLPKAIELASKIQGRRIAQ